MTTCPLPVDWLDLLEGRPSVAARAHLDGCASCRAVVAALTDGLPDPPMIPQRVGGATTNVRAVFDDVADPVIVEGQQRWLTVDGADVRLPVLVLGLVDEDSGSADLDDAGAETTAAAGTSMPSLVDIVPLWTDRENATSADLLLDESDTTTGVAWRAVFRRQTTVPADLLTDLFGSLTMTGEAAVAHALAGRLPPERTGVELESEFDPRLTADEWMTDVLYRAVERVEESGDPLVTGLFRSPARTPAPLRRDDTQIDVAATTAPDPPGAAKGRNICVSSRASIGGAAAAGGAAFQDEVFAWACAAMVAEQPLPTPMPPDTVVRVGAQTGYEVDDVAIETAADGLVLCQVKARLALG